MQLAICAVLYIIFYLIKNTNYIFSEDVLNKTKEFLSYDINFGTLQNQISVFIEENKNKFEFLGIFDNEQNNITNEIVNEIANNVNENAIITNETGGIGGATSNEIVEEENKKEDEDDDKNETKKSQSELDIEYIKENYKFKMPVTGTVTSRYGKREATEVVSANHQGIDIGANEGTAIYAAIEGTVTVSSEEGEYGKHIDIENGDVLKIETYERDVNGNTEKKGETLYTYDYDTINKDDKIEFDINNYPNYYYETIVNTDLSN